MRILTWNINGVRTLPQYHPWNTLKTGDAILDELGADIICFQEMKSTRPSLARTFALPASYDALFSFPTSKAGYSGVAVYTKQPLTPSKVEEGLTGTVHPKIKPPWDALTERVSGVDAYPSPRDFDILLAEAEDEDAEIEGMVPSEAEPAIPELDLASLDAEGRTLVADFGLFVLINTYCPVDSPSPARHAYKMAYHRLLSMRVRRLIAEGREVVLVGDINVCVAAEDHCDGGLESVKEGFYDHSARRWARGLFGEGDVEGEERMLVDVVRRQWPDRKAMFTCWNTKISARASNYGTRIDYILVTPALLPWIKGADIEPRIQGSDHCPVWADFKDEIQVAGQTVRLDDVMKHEKEPPRVASRYWEEYSGKQKLLSSFFGNGKGSAKQSAGASPMDLDVAATGGPTSSQASAALSSTPSPSIASTSTLSQASKPPSSQPPSQQSLKKRKELHDSEHLSVSKNSGKQPKKPKAGQTKLSSFFGSPQTTAEPTAGSDRQDDGDHLDADYRFALEVSKQQDPPTSMPLKDISKTSSSSSAAWSTLLAPLQPPLCTVHREPAQGFTVNKAGPNKGKKFFVCARPVGPGYDKGKAEIMRAEVDHKWKCGYFKWASDARKEAGSSKGDAS
ncbi:DNase I-like protein [Athelia psychrophila]|uniref:DNA-(apurinic or apyrimidinic site) endonuclease 2 n=1 Tax=Athelia psychrophila TaxID=1759441 RepID=A0A166DB53_9AGAM|nr:DNase I-like protein [Fibularhizoctonia sp. CBS 109695]